MQFFDGQLLLQIEAWVRSAPAFSLFLFYPLFLFLFYPVVRLGTPIGTSSAESLRSTLRGTRCSIVIATEHALELILIKLIGSYYQTRVLPGTAGSSFAFVVHLSLYYIYKIDVLYYKHNNRLVTSFRFNCHHLRFRELIHPSFVETWLVERIGVLQHVLQVIVIT